MTYNKPIQPPLHDGLTLYVRSCIYVRTWSLFQLRCRRIVYEMKLFTGYRVAIAQLLPVRV